MKATPGIRRRHAAGCLARSDDRIRCDCPFEASIYDKASGKKIRKTRPTFAAARAWQADAEQAVRGGELSASDPVTVRDAAEQLTAGMESGAIRNRSGDPYKPSAIRGYREALELYVLPELGAMKLRDVKRRHVQRLADRLLADGRSPSTVRNAIMPLRVIYRIAIRDELANVNPCSGLDLPANRSARPDVVSVGHASR